MDAVAHVSAANPKANNMMNRPNPFNKQSTVARIVGAVVKVIALVAVAVTIFALAAYVATLAYGVTARVWHLPPMTWRELLCTYATVAGFAGAFFGPLRGLRGKGGAS